MDYTALWAYQKVDMALEAAESELRKSTARRTALKLRTYIKEQQHFRTICEKDLEGLKKTLAGLQSRAEALVKEAEGCAIVNQENQPLSVLQSKLDDLQDVLQRIESVDTLLSEMIGDLEERAAKISEGQKKLPAARAEYEKTKTIFDGEMEAAKPQLDDLKKQLNALSANVPPEVLERYKAIRANKLPPMVKLMGEQCGGCSMELPSSVVRAIKAGRRIVECEECGRILSA